MGCGRREKRVLPMAVERGNMSKQAILGLDADACKAQAAEYHACGFNCAQAVACTLAPAIDVDVDQAFRLMEGFGGGMGGFSETCGAISGGVMAAGWVKSTGAENPTSKRHTYKLAREICTRFKEKNGTTNCAVLKGIDMGAGPLRTCPGCIDDAVEIAVAVLQEDAR